MFNPIAFDITSLDIRYVLHSLKRDKNKTFDDVKKEIHLFAESYKAVENWIEINMPTSIEVANTQFEYTEKIYSGFLHEPPTELKKIATLYDINELILAIILMVHGQQSKSIQKICFNSAKDYVSNFIYQANNKYFAIKQASITVDKLSIDQSLTMSFIDNVDSINSILLLNKKITALKNKKTNFGQYYLSCIELRKDFVNELYLICEQFKPLKEFIIDNSPFKYIKPNPETLRICGYCFRNIRLSPKTENLIAYHGFIRDNYYGSGVMINQSCDGAMMQTLESSPKATQFLVDNSISVLALNRIENLEKKLIQLRQLRDEIKQTEQGISSNSVDLRSIKDQESKLYQQTLAGSQLISDVIFDLRLAKKMLEQYHPHVVEETFSKIPTSKLDELEEKNSKIKKEILS